jgi:hypothetical protein
MVDIEGLCPFVKSYVFAEGCLFDIIFYEEIFIMLFDFCHFRGRRAAVFIPETDGSRGYPLLPY